MPVLVTGGAGFLGINLRRHLLSRGHVVRSLDIAPPVVDDVGPERIGRILAAAVGGGGKH